MKVLNTLSLFLTINILNSDAIDSYTGSNPTISLVNGVKTLVTANCDTSTSYIYLRLEGIEAVNADAFENCTHVSTIHLMENKISNLHPDTFKHTKNLKVLDLSCNNLTSIPEDLLSPLGNLTNLDVSGNTLGSIRAIMNVELDKLKNFYFNSVGIFSEDIDPELLHKKFPSLKVIKASHNFVTCSEMEIIEEKFSQLGVYVWKSHLCASDGKRCYDDEEVAAFRQTLSK